MLILGLISGLLIKHFIADYLLQLPFMLNSKDRYFSQGAAFHAVIHGLGTGAVFAFFGLVEVAGTMAILDILIHYHVDFFKATLNKNLALKPDNSKFWHLLGLDQLVHQLTYVLLVALALAK